MSDFAPLTDVRVVNAAINLPAAATAARLAELGAVVTKVEPPDGDPTQGASAELYERLTHGQTIVTLDLKDAADRERLAVLLDAADLLITSSRPSALARMGLGWADLERRHPRLAQVAIVGHPAPNQEIAGHDLTYMAHRGLLAPPANPRTLMADLCGAERAATTALALLHGREAGSGPRYAEVALEDAAAYMSLPWTHGLTTEAGPLGGASPYYRLYEAKDGWVALAALERRFQERVLEAFGLEEPAAEAFAAEFRAQTTEEWERWAKERDVPLAAVR